MDSKTQQVPMDALYQAEEELKMCAPILEKKRAAEAEKQQLEDRDIAKAKQTMKGGLSGTIVGAVFFVFSFVVRLMIGDLMFYFQSLMWTGLVIGGACLIWYLSVRSKLNRFQNRVAELDELIRTADSQLEAKRQERSPGMEAYRRYMPAECIDPRHARMFISYFEQGRAQSLGQATGLFEEYIHRVHLEQAAQDQLNAQRYTARDAWQRMMP